MSQWDGKGWFDRGLQISDLIIKIWTLQNQWLERINGSNPTDDDGTDECQIGLIIVIYRDNDELGLGYKWAP